MNCCQCQGIEEIFSQEYVNKELSRYHRKGPEKTTRILTGAIRGEGVEGLTLLDIGGGVGAVQYDLLEAGVVHATDVEASTAYTHAAKAEAQRRGQADRITYRRGNFVDLAADIPPADIVTLDRVICCYPEMEKMVRLSAERTRRIYGLVYPRDTWWLRMGIAFQNLFLRVRGSPFRSYVHPSRAVEAILASNGFKRSFYRRTLLWQVSVYTRLI